ncbi:hypothetical protein OG453_06960 [Streptomyces sp. NBC_01381]|uniref:hypothetical protein n=1 Tax=Streptomyces sp. NBC_01381 TaxID=2903845 RepID=UPI00224CBC28|nr:hypothetical protein [Streptomyces sp. NBC_01381]MCX4666407.1 hypothetical protein [Streptomyces sp. NBC_01381]
MDPIIWLRSEYKGREDELITLSAAANLAGVSRSAVSNWAKRHKSFPPLALLTGPPTKQVKWVVREEFLDFARIQLEKPRGGHRTPQTQRPTLTLRVNEVTHYTQQVKRLTELIDRHKQALTGAEARLRTAQQRLNRAQARLDAELAAANQHSTDRRQQ